MRTPSQRIARQLVRQLQRPQACCSANTRSPWRFCHHASPIAIRHISIERRPSRIRSPSSSIASSSASIPRSNATSLSRYSASARRATSSAGLRSIASRNAVLRRIGIALAAVALTEQQQRLDRHGLAGLRPLLDRLPAVSSAAGTSPRSNAMNAARAWHAAASLKCPARWWWSAIVSRYSSRRSPARAVSQRRDLRVQLRPIAEQHRLVGDVAEQRMLERELAASGERRILLPMDQLALDGGAECRSSAPRRRAQPTASSQNVRPDDRGVLQRGALVVGELIETSLEHPCDRRRHVRRVELAGSRIVQPSPSASTITPRSRSILTSSSTKNGLPSDRSTIRSTNRSGT